MNAMVLSSRTIQSTIQFFVRKDTSDVMVIVSRGTSRGALKTIKKISLSMNYEPISFFSL